MSFPIYNVNPGDLITADFMNSVLQELSALDSSVTSLAARVTALERELGSPPAKASKETKEGKEGKETKEGKDFKDKDKDKEQFEKIKDNIDGKGGKEVIKDVEKGKEVEKSVEKSVEKIVREKTQELAMEQPVTTLAGVAATAPSDPKPVQPAAQHFISAELRPELAASALRSEPDQVSGDSGGAG